MKKTIKLILISFLTTTSLFAINPEEVSFGPHYKQKMDIYEQNSKEVLFFVHGGAWKMGDKRNLIRHKLKMKKTFVTPNYRLDATIFNQVKDIFMAYQKTRELYPDKRIVLSGHSAGAHLALMALLKYDLKEDIIVLDTSFDLTNKKGIVYSAWKRYSLEEKKQLSPIFNLKKLNSKFLIVSSKRNKKDSTAFFNELKKYAPNSELYLTNYSHGKINKQLGNKRLNIYYNKTMNFIENK